MNVKTALTHAMTEMAKDPATLFVGYGMLKNGANGTLVNVPKEQIVECPVSEQLIADVALGLSLKGRKVVAFFERADFMLLAMSSIVSHLDKIAHESRGEFTPGIIIRVCVGNTLKPLFTGSTHTSDFTKPMKHLVKFPVTRLMHGEHVIQEYREAHKRLPNSSTMLVEFKDNYQ